MTDILYKKVGRKYVPATELFQGFPKSGVWIVSAKGERGRWSGYWIMNLGDPGTVMTQAAFMRHKDKVAEAIGKARQKMHSTIDLADAAIKAVIEAEEKV